MQQQQEPSHCLQPPRQSARSLDETSPEELPDNDIFDYLCQDLHVAEKKGRGRGGNFAEASGNRHRRKYPESDHKKEV